MHIKEGLIIKEIDNEYVLIDSGIVPPIFNGIIKLNGTGRYIISLLQDKDLSLEELYETLLDKYDIDKKSLQESIKPFLEELRRVKLIND